MYTTLAKVFTVVVAGVLLSLIEYYGATYIFPEPKQALGLMVISYGIARVLRFLTV